jgi:hypothetical protein
MVFSLACGVTILAASAEGMGPEFKQVGDGVWTADGVHFVSHSNYALQNFTGLKSGDCDTYATDEDVHKTHKESKLTDMCKQHFGCGDDLDAWHTNQDGKETCITHGTPDFSGGDPKNGSKQLNCLSLTNNRDVPATQTVQLSGEHTDTVSVGLTVSSSFSETLSVEVDIPEVMKVTDTASFVISSSSTEQHSDSHASGHAESVSATVDPHSSACAIMDGKTVDYNSDFTVSVCLSGIIRCQYSSRCKGHYFWYFSLGGEDVCSNMKGTATSNSITETKAVINKGKCEAGCGQMEVAHTSDAALV